MGHTEFEVGAALFSAGFISSKSIFSFLAQTDKGNPIPENFKPYIEKREIIPGKEQGFIKEYYNLGKTITGQSK